MLKFFRQMTQVVRYNLHKVTTNIETTRICKEFLQTKGFFCQLFVIQQLGLKKLNLNR